MLIIHYKIISHFRSALPNEQFFREWKEERRFKYFFRKYRKIAQVKVTRPEFGYSINHYFLKL